MAAPGGGGGLSYIPQPHERAYYDGLFQAADTQRKGAIGGPEAVQFFARSKLPLEQLKNVWTVADNPPSNSLDRRKFAVSIRLIQLLQNGVKGQGADLAAPPGANLRPVFLEGISGVSVQLPPNPQQQQQQPPPQQQQQQPPPPPQQQQQQQQQPPPQQQGGGPPQQQQQPPNTSGGRPPMAPQSPGGGPPSIGGGASVGGGASTALTVQDPYTLTPQERSRYESIFPQYAKEDGYMHGKEAVELFSKSGLDQTKLRDIWNMADQPVDNKLDKLEFAIAMHLIVCISKKNLPMPKLLPFSLKTLKQQQQQQQEQQQPPQDQPAYNPQQQQQPQQEQPSIPEPPPTNRIHAASGGDSVMSGMTHPSTMQGPPPIANPGGMDISDAFAGLSASDGPGGLPPPTNGFGNVGSGFGGVGQQMNEQASYGGGMEATSSMGQPSPKLEPTQAPAPPRIQENIQPNPSAVSVASSIPEPTPKSSEALASSYNMSDSSGELTKLKTVLQKLQAENISLKAQLGTMSEEEKDVQKQINATVAEIGDLSNHLTTLRAQVLASKTRLMELTAELTAAHEKKGVMKDLIGEAEATKEAIETAHQGLEASIHAAHAPQPAPAPSYDLFDFGAAPAPAPAPPTNMARAPSHDSHHEPQYGAAPASYSSPAPIPYSQPDGGAFHQPHVDTVSSDDSSEAEGEHFSSNPEGDNSQAQPMLSYDQGYDTGNVNAPGHEAPDPYQGISLEQNFLQNPPPSHNKQSSISSLNFEVMGGGPVPQNQFAYQQQEQEQEDMGGLAPAPSLEEIEQLKKKSKEADELARDSENTLRQLMAKADELREAADKAELEARQKLAEASEKKKGGFMGGGKKKKSMKEATQAQGDAETKKKKFLEAQSRANDAQAVAMETKREAEKLRKEAEQAEIDAAAAASMEKQPAPAPTPAPQPPNGYQNQGQYAQPQGYGQPQHGYGGPQGYGQPPHPAQGYGGFNQNPPHGGGYNPSVMAGGAGGSSGIDIPDPGNDPYSNPF